MSNTYTVLIIDDNFDDRFVLKRHLRRTGLSLVILEANDGVKGLKLLTIPLEELESQYPRISGPVTLFLDINLPLMTGWEFVEELERRRADIQLKPTKIMIYSSSDSHQEKETAQGFECVMDYMVKGESTTELVKQAVMTSQA